MKKFLKIFKACLKIIETLLTIVVVGISIIIVTQRGKFLKRFILGRRRLSLTEPLRIDPHLPCCPVQTPQPPKLPYFYQKG